MKLKFVIAGIVLLTVGLILRSVFIVELRFLKEEFLIKRNYSINEEAFRTWIPYFIDLPNIELNFRNETELELIISSNDVYNFSENDSVHQKLLSHALANHAYIWITDTSATLSQGDFVYDVFDLWLDDSILNVSTADRLLSISEGYQISYSGKLKSEFIQRLFTIAHLDLPKLNEIRHKLKELNCFGYSKDFIGNLILNYRTNSYYFFDSFSYLVLKPDSDISEIDYLKSNHGKLDEKIYWFHNERYGVSYSPYLKLSNREI